MTHDGPGVCKQLEEYLLAKLGKDHAGVKYKVLRIIRFVCENDGSPEFRRIIQRRADIIRQCQSFRGTVDPLKGDAPNKAVRDEATATMQALFAAENSTSASHSALSQCMQTRIQGVGSSDLGYQAPAPSRPITYTSSTGHRPMEGVGNPYFANTSNDSSTASFSSIIHSDNPGREIISAMTTGVQSVAQSLAKAATPYLPASIQQHIQTPSYTSSPRSDWVPPKISVPVPTYVEPAQPRVSDSEMLRVVNELCLSNPARSTPSQQAINSLISKCQEVDGVIVAETLMAKLQDPGAQWTHKLKVLHGIEALHVAGLDLMSESIKQSPSGLLGLFPSPQCGVKARQVATQLGLIDGDVAVAPKSKTPSPPLIDDLIDVCPSTMAVKGGEDLLDFGEPASARIENETVTSLI